MKSIKLTSLSQRLLDKEDGLNRQNGVYRQDLNEGDLRSDLRVDLCGRKGHETDESPEKHV